MYLFPQEVLGLDRSIVRGYAIAILTEISTCRTKGKLHKLHRIVFRIFLDGEPPFETVLQAWVDTHHEDMSLAQLAPAEFLRMLEYALTPIVEEEAEGEHAKLAQLLQGHDHRLPDQNSALLRAPQTLSKLDDQKFFGWAERTWKARGVLKHLLAFIDSPVEVRLFNNRDIRRRVYQYDLKYQFHDTTVEQRSLNDKFRQHPDMVSDKVEETDKMGRGVIRYLKDRMLPPQVYSAPGDIFARACMPVGGNTGMGLTSMGLAKCPLSFSARRVAFMGSLPGVITDMLPFGWMGKGQCPAHWRQPHPRVPEVGVEFAANPALAPLHPVATFTAIMDTDRTAMNLQVGPGAGPVWPSLAQVAGPPWPGRAARGQARYGSARPPA